MYCEYEIEDLFRHFEKINKEEFFVVAFVKLSNDTNYLIYIFQDLFYHI